MNMQQISGGVCAAKGFTANGIHTYFWKVVPKRVGGEQA